MPDDLTLAWQRLRSSRETPTSGLHTTLNLAQSSRSPRRLRPTAPPEPAADLGDPRPRFPSSLAHLRVDLGPPSPTTTVTSTSQNEVVSREPAADLGDPRPRFPSSLAHLRVDLGPPSPTKTVASTSQNVRGADTSLHAEEQVEDQMLATIKERLAAVKVKQKSLEDQFDTLCATHENLQQALQEAQDHEPQNDLKGGIKERLDALTAINEDLQRKVHEAKQQELAREAEKDMLKKELEDAEKQAEDKATSAWVSQALPAEVEEETASASASQAKEPDPLDWLQEVRIKGLALEEAPKYVQNARDVVMAAVLDDGLALEFASEELKKDKDLARGDSRRRKAVSVIEGDLLANTRKLQQVGPSGHALQFASHAIRSDKEVLLAAVQQDGTALEFASEDLKKDKELVLAALQKDTAAFQFASNSSQKDKDVLIAKATAEKKYWLKEVRLNGFSLEEVPEHVVEKELVMVAVEQNGHALSLASEEFQDNKEIVLAAVRQNATALEFASEKLKNDKEVVLTAVQKDPSGLRYASITLRRDGDVASAEKKSWLDIVRRDGRALQDVPETLRKEKDIVLAAVEQYGRAFQFAPEELRKDKETVVAAVSRSTAALPFVSEELREDKDVVLAQAIGEKEEWFQQVRRDGLTFRLLSEPLRNDRSIILAAVKSNGKALEFVSEELKTDPDFILSVLKEDGTKMQFVPEAFRKDPDFLLRAVRATKASWLINFCSDELRTDQELGKKVREAAGTGIVFTYYDHFNCFDAMRKKFLATGASIPGGTAYDKVMDKLKKTEGGTATVWFDETPVFGFSADNGNWVHPSHDCGRDYVPVPAAEKRHPMWNSMVESRTTRMEPPVGSKHPCWCCHWLRKIMEKHREGAVICCAVSNIYFAEWVDKYGAGSSELSDSAAEKYGLKKEYFRNGRPAGWGEGFIQISDGSRFSRVAPVHPYTQKPLGEGCRWERQALDNLGFTVYAFFVP